MDQTSQNVAWINYSRTSVSTISFDAICAFLGQFTIRCIQYFQKGVGHFEIEHTNANFWLGVGHIVSVQRQV